MNGIRAPVGIVGGRPAGLMTAIELGSRGVRCVLFEEEAAAPWLPKANSSTARTMEPYRRHDIAEDIRDVGLVEDHPQDVANFTLLQLDRATDARPLAEAARSMGIPMRVLRLDSEEARELYGVDLTLVRPDHHVAWRSNSLPSEPESLLRKITGG